MPSTQEVQQRFYENHPDYNREWKLAKSLKVHGLTREEYDVLVALGCAICGAHPERLRFDHDHETDEFRGLLCNNCNVAIGMLDDDTDRLEAAISYLNAAKWKR